MRLVTLVHHTGVSWPRSGHHLLVSLLKGYFGPAFGYCEFHKGDDPLPGMACCGRVPCAHPDRITLSKNHDFALDVPQLPGGRYLVQYRDFVPSVVSNYELYLRGGHADTPASFRKFASQQFDSYLDFTRKWVTSDFMQGQIVLHYDALTGDPVAALAHVVQAMAPDQAPDMDRIRATVAAVDGQSVTRGKVQVLQGTGVTAARRVEDFRHYDAALFDLLDRLQLPRGTVLRLFRARMGRHPAEQTVLHLQAHASPAALDAMLCATPEYRNRAETETVLPDTGAQ